MTTNLVRVLITTAISLAAVTASRSAGAAPRVAGCVNVQDFLADPADSATDDAAPIRSAIAAALATSGPHVVCLPGGVYNLLTTAAGQDVFDLSAATDLAIVGEGPATVLKLGDVGASSMQVFNLASGSARIRFQDLVIDGTAQPNATAATSLFRIGDGATTVSDITLDSVQLVGSGGAGVVIDGASSATTVASIAIRSSRFAANKGSAIKLLQGADRILITGNSFSGNAGYEIEASQSVRAITGVTITNNVFAHPAASAQPVAIFLSGPAGGPSLDATIADNLVLGGRVVVQRFAQVAIAGNSITGGTQATTDPELLIGPGARSISVTTNVIERFSCTAGHVVQLGQLGQPTGSLESISLVGNALVQAAVPAPAGSCGTVGVASAVQVAPASNVVISGNHVGFAAAAPAVTGISVGPASVGFSYVTVANNTIDSVSLAAAIELGGGDGIPPRVLVTDNVSRGAATGVQVDAMQSPYIPMITNNVFPGATTAIALSAGNPAVAIRGNFTGPTQLTGPGSPETRIAAPIGSLYFQTDATARGLWVKEAGTGNTGWQFKN
jgi:hypothetical protein